MRTRDEIRCQVRSTPFFAEPAAGIEEPSVTPEYLAPKHHRRNPERHLSQDQEGRTHPGLLRGGERG